MCGQVAVAMLLGIELEESIAAVGHTHGTQTKELVRALWKFGMDAEDRCKRITAKTVMPLLGLGQVHDPKRRSGWHWVALNGALIYDGVWGSPDGTVKWPRGFRLTSYTPVWHA